MKFTAKNLTEARNFLKERGFTFTRYGLKLDGRGGENRNKELYSADGLTAMVWKKFQRVEVRMFAA